MDVGTHSGGMEYEVFRSTLDPSESNRIMSKGPMMLSVVALRVISTADGHESANEDVFGRSGCGNLAGPVGPCASPKDSAEESCGTWWLEISKCFCFALSVGQYSSK